MVLGKANPWSLKRQRPEACMQVPVYGVDQCVVGSFDICGDGFRL